MGDLLPSRYSRTLSSPFLLLILLLFASTLSLALYRSKTPTNSAPIIAGYDWTMHSDTLMVVYPLADACSHCNLSIAGWTRLGLEHHLDVLVIAAHNTEELKRVRAYIKSPHLTVVTNMDEPFVKHFSRGDLIGGVHIHDGRIIARQLGGTPPTTFLQVQRNS